MTEATGGGRADMEGRIIQRSLDDQSGDGNPLGLFYAATLYGGFALYLAGHLLFKQRMYATLSVPRLVMVVLLFALPAAAYLPSLIGLAGLVLLLVVLIGLETRRYATLGAGVRPG
jgi:hypothetical protein